MIQSARLLIVLIASLALLSLVAGCGGGSVATIDNQVDISDGSYQRFLNSTVANYEKAGNELDGPDFKDCIAKLKKSGLKEKEAKKNCQEQYQGLERQIFAQLVQQGWVLAAAEQAGVKFNDKQLQSQVKTLAKQFPEVDGGVNQDDLLWLAKANSAQAALQQKDLSSIKPTSAEIQSFYSKNKALFNKPRSRDINLLVSSSKAKADQAAKALRAKTSWDKVFKQYNDSKLYNSRTARASNVSEGNFAPDLAKFIFAAPLNQVYGPKQIKPINGWAVVEVTKSSPARSAAALAKIKDQVVAVYRSEMINKKGRYTAAKLAEKYQPLTDCADDYKAWYPCKGTKP